MSKSIDFFTVLRDTAQQLHTTSRLSKTTDFHPEDQLKTPITELLKQAAVARGISCATVTEVHTEVGRPDIGVLTKKLLTGYCELKAPGKGANPERFAGVDKEQWRRFKKIPNLLYTDGNEWALYRSGERKGVVVRLGDLTADGDKAITAKNAAELLSVLSDFLVWEPEVPSNPRSLAKMLAPLCQLLRDNVEAALADDKTDLSVLASDWRQWFFPRADNATFADAYAQTLTYALLLSRKYHQGCSIQTRPVSCHRVSSEHEQVQALYLRGRIHLSELAVSSSSYLSTTCYSTDPCNIDCTAKNQKSQ